MPLNQRKLTDVYLTIARNIKKYRVKKKMTQKELAIQIGLSEGGIRKAMTKLKNAGIIMREGSTKNGNWKVVEDK